MALIRFLFPSNHQSKEQIRILSPELLTPLTMEMEEDCSSSSTSTSLLPTIDWTKLPPELLHKISTHLPNLPDLLRFRSVCSPWRSAAASTRNLPPQLPWLLLPPDTNDTNNSNNRRFFSPSENRIYTLPNFPDFLSKRIRIFPSPDGHVITVPAPSTNGGTRSLSLLNPITRSSSPFPPLTVPEHRHPILESFQVRTVKHFGPHGVVGALCPGKPAIFFCRSGDAEWKQIDTTDCYLHDFAYHDGKFFVVNMIERAVTVFDCRTLRRVSEIQRVRDPHICEFMYLAESPAGDLLLLVRNGRDRERRFELFQLDDASEEQLKWVEISNIGNMVLFVDCIQVMAFNAGEFSGCRGNCIYFVDFVEKGKVQDYGVMVFDIGERRVQPNPLLSDNSPVKWRMAIWVVPSLC